MALEIDNFGGDQPLARQTSSSLRRILSHNKAITVVSDETAEQVGDETDLILDGHANRTLDGMVEITVELVSTDTNTILWAKAVKFPDDAQLQSRIAQVLGDELRVRIFGATKTELAKRDPDTLTPEQLFIMTTWVPGTALNAAKVEHERIRLMRLALEKDPNFCSAHSVIADKLAYLANVYGSSNTEELQYEALAHGRRARELSPLNPDVMFNVAHSLWHSGHIVASKAAMDRAVELDQSHAIAKFLSVLIPYTCSSPPDETLQWAIAFDQSLSRDNPIRWLTLTWIAGLHVNRAEYEEALLAEEKAALIFEVPYSTMRHAMILNKLGRPQDAAEIIQMQNSSWPGIDPDHFAEVTLPRLCSEAQMHPELIENYRDLAAALKDKS
jgi:tetratricopeptide (TPR) repeat protein